MDFLWAPKNWKYFGISRSDVSENGISPGRDFLMFLTSSKYFWHKLNVLIRNLKKQECIIAISPGRGFLMFLTTSKYFWHKLIILIINLKNEKWFLQSHQAGVSLCFWPLPKISDRKLIFWAEIYTKQRKREFNIAINPYQVSPQNQSLFANSDISEWKYLIFIKNRWCS